MTLDKKSLDALNENLNDIKKLFQQSNAIQLYRAGATQKEISLNLGIAIGTVNKMVKGIKKE